jgi:hypothetical protein
MAASLRLSPPSDHLLLGPVHAVIEAFGDKNLSLD